MSALAKFRKCEKSEYDKSSPIKTGAAKLTNEKSEQIHGKYHRL